MEVITVINCDDVQCVSERVKAAKEFSQWLHLDVADARFTFNKSWGDPVAWSEIGKGVNTEVHLMVEEPEKAAGAWLDAGAKRLIVHLETINEQSLQEIKKSVEERGAELMIAVNPETPVENLAPYFKEVSRFQILGVYPGPSGQNFLPLVLEKIKFLRQQAPDATIEVDGGINLETAKLVKDAGADIVVSGSYIFNSADPKATYEKLKGI